MKYRRKCRTICVVLYTNKLTQCQWLLAWLVFLYCCEINILFFHQPSNNIIGNLKHKIQNSTVLKNTNVFLFVFIQGKYKLIAKEWIGWTCDSHNKKDVRARRRRKIVWCFGMLLQAESFQPFLLGFPSKYMYFCLYPNFPQNFTLMSQLLEDPHPPTPPTQSISLIFDPTQYQSLITSSVTSHWVFLSPMVNPNRFTNT